MSQTVKLPELRGNRKKGTNFYKLSRPGEVIIITCETLWSANRSVDVDLSALIPSLDNVAAELASQQRDSMTQRKELADKTKAFRRMDDAGKLVEVKALLKGVYPDVVSA